jgi:hypothetical protein
MGNGWTPGIIQSGLQSYVSTGVLRRSSDGIVLWGHEVARQHRRQTRNDSGSVIPRVGLKRRSAFRDYNVLFGDLRDVIHGLVHLDVGLMAGV